MSFLWPVVILTAAYLLDLLLGDPPRRSHPVRLIGRVAGWLERWLRIPCSHAVYERAAGVVLFLAVTVGSGAVACWILQATRQVHPLLGLLAAIYLTYAMLAVGDMVRHVRAVDRALASGDLSLARERVSLLVGRETRDLRETGIVMAALESMFENTADGVLAPLFYAALGGPAAAVVFKAVSTLDSMVGHRTPRYRHFGWFPARVDDLMNYIPARLTALLFILAALITGRDWRGGLRVLRSDRRNHDSPNSAWPEAAAAGVLGVRLGGPAFYEGKEVSRPYINQGGKAPDRADIEDGLRLFRHVSALSTVTAVGLALTVVLLTGALQ